MGLVWNPWGLAGLVGLACAWLVAAFVYGAAPGRPVNRVLALLLFFEGVDVGTSGLAFLAGDPGAFHGATVVHMVADAVLPPLYLLFLGLALDTRPARLLRRRPVQALLAGAALALPGAVLLAPRAFAAGITRPPPGLEAYSPFWWELGPAWSLLALLLAAAFFLGLALSVQAWREARTGAARRRARAFLLAFGLKDVVWGAVFLLAAVQSGASLALATLLQAYALVVVPYSALVAYGILRAQLFDLDVKLRWGLRRGTLAGMFLAVFFVVAQLAQNFLTNEFGWALGGLAAGLLLFAIAPLQRVAERVTDSALPLPARGADPRLTFYREQVELAWADGAFTRRERRMLDAAAQRLGLSLDEAARVEREVAG